MDQIKQIDQTDQKSRISEYSIPVARTSPQWARKVCEPIGVSVGSIPDYQVMRRRTNEPSKNL